MFQLIHILVKLGDQLHLRNDPTSLSSAPPPEINAFKFPPNCSLIFFLTKRSQTKFIKLSINENGSLFNFLFPSLRV